MYCLLPECLNLVVYGFMPMFSTIFTKGNNFCDLRFLSMDDGTLPEWDLVLKERICSKGSDFFPLTVDTEKGDKNENDKSCFS